MWNCVAHADLYKRQKAIDAKDRATAIDIKVQLREKRRSASAWELCL